jgi:hypothetical protein
MDSTILFIGIGLIAAGVAVAWTITRKRKWNRIFQELASHHNLGFSKSNLFSGAEVSGVIEEFAVRVFQKSFSHGKSSTATIGFQAHFAPMAVSLQIRPEGFWSRTFNLENKTDIQFEDKFFDDLALVYGSSQHQVRALLHPAAKRIIADCINDCFGNRFELVNGALETYIKEDHFQGADEISAVLLEIITLGKLLCRQSGPEAMLRENFKAETDDHSRTAYVESLAALNTHLDEKDDVIQAALRSGHPPLQFAAARAIGTAGDRCLPEIFRTAKADLSLSILAYLERRKAAHLVPDFISLGKRIRDWKIKTALVRFLAACRHDSTEPYLHGELSDEVGIPGNYKKECIRALGACGTVASIALLHGLKGVFLRRDIENAITAIQARLDPGQTGMLSLHGTESEEGALSMPEDAENKPR